MYHNQFLLVIWQRNDNAVPLSRELVSFSLLDKLITKIVMVDKYNI